MIKYARRVVLFFCGALFGISISIAGREVPHHSYYGFPLLADVIDSIERFYVTPLTREELIEAAIQGIFQKLDGYSEFLDAEDVAKQDENNQGQYKGFGFEVNGTEHGLAVINVFAGSPAQKAGIELGDTITHLSKQVISLDNQETILKQIKTAANDNQPIDVNVKDTKGKQWQLNIKPNVIHVAAIESKVLENNLGYIRINGFQSSTFDSIKTQLISWRQQQLNGLIIDLRRNPGGLFEQAVKVADLFISKGTIVSTKGRFKQANSDYSATDINLLKDVPMLVLIDKNSASAAEVLAAALQQNQRAILMGERSYGKGSIQGMIPTIFQDSRVKLTIAHYLTPKGDNIHQSGITPDINLPSMTGNASNNAPIINDTQADSDDNALKSAISWFKTDT
ncbi:PDZ domain-containing protein [Parashewanella curva]|uniref:PDZ domain-containing protein n=1 Tax=Parashewanella curva TaxID=2338552 RepID=A0A3L8PTW5_9GAMM|nr:S41 family peptidase [Parashewanella curva]RLV58746.1 PDZ domain-containing protein [Parashewanella curva]